MSSVWPAKRGRKSTGPRSVVMTTRLPLDHPGGVESVARALMDYLGRREEGWRVSHVAAYTGRVGVARIPLIGDLVAAGRLAARIIRKGDVLLVHGAEYAWGALAVGWLTRRPVVAVWHGVRASEAIPPAKHRLGKAAIRFFLRSESLLQRVALLADATVVVSPVVAKDLQSRYGIGDELKVIPNGVAMRSPSLERHLHDDVRSPASPNGSPLRVMWVGTSVYNKRLDLALAACEIARARGQDISLTVVGIAAESAGLEPESGGSWLTWLGSVPPHEMPSLYGRHDVLLFPSRREACPMSVLEALAAGLPVIGSATAQWLIEGVGEVVAGEDPSSYAEALRALAEPERRHRLASAALERARQYSWESCAAGYLEVLDSVERQRRRRYHHLSKQNAFPAQARSEE
jgi:glycosyltransferase involved in cell wall biosynthesis